MHCTHVRLASYRIEPFSHYSTHRTKSCCLKIKSFDNLKEAKWARDLKLQRGKWRSSREKAPKSFQLAHAPIICICVCASVFVFLYLCISICRRDTWGSSKVTGPPRRRSSLQAAFAFCPIWLMIIPKRERSNKFTLSGWIRRHRHPLQRSVYPAFLDIKVRYVSQWEWR